MYAVIGEDKSDAEMLAVLMRRLANDQTLTIKTFGYSGCAQMLSKGARQLKSFAGLGCSRFVVCHDADGDDPNVRYNRVMERIVRPAGVAGSSCIVIPVQEIEAWILADIEAVTKVFSSWKPKPIH